MHVICYTGGTCGDIVTAVIDTQDIVIHENRMRVSEERSKFKKSHLFESKQQKDLCFTDMAQRYKSIPSHDLEYHSQCGHDIIGITVQDKALACWAAERFKRLHRPHVWEEMTQVCGATSVDEYAEMMIHYGNLVRSKTQKILQLENILAGNLIKDLETLEVSSNGLNTPLYQQWLSLQKYI